MAGSKKKDHVASRSRDLRQNSNGLLFPALQLALHPLAYKGRAQFKMDEPHRLQNEDMCPRSLSLALETTGFFI
jgi:hypothetical protein